MTSKRIPFSALRYHWPVYLFVVPSMVLIGLFQYYPAISGAFHSFFRWNGADIKEFVGLRNYAELLQNEEFWQSFRVTLALGFWNVIKMIPAIAAAVCIHRCRSTRTQFIYRVLFVAPMVIPGLIVVLIWRGLFFEATSGYLNRLLFSTGLFDVLVRLDHLLGWGGVFREGSFPAWLGDGRLILAACIIWGFPWVGSFAVLTHLAKLQGIPKDLYEAADIDGATWWGKFWRIELPLMMGSINLLLVFVVIDTIKDAGMIMSLAGLQGGPGGVVTVPALFMLRKAFTEQQMGAACAVGITLTIVVLTLQKLLGALSNWSSLSSWQKAIARSVCLLAAAMIHFQLNSAFIATVVACASLPWPTIAECVIAAIRRCGIAAGPAAGSREGGTDALPRHERLKSALLRGLKHSFVWLILASAYLPLYLMLVVSLKDNTQFYAAPAAATAPFHWENWQTAFAAVIPSLANSIFITISSTALTVVTALAGAYFFARVRMPGSTLLWNAILILMMMPTIANLVPLFRLLIDLNLANTLSALVLVGAAGGQVFAIFTLRSFVADIPPALFEAAEIDGASHLRQMFTIVAPLSGPILGVVGVMHAIAQWNDFILPLIVIRDPMRFPVMVQLLRMAGEYVKFWGPLMAAYLLASLPIIVLFIMCMRLFTRGMTDGAVKG